ncbi:MAG: J domain-containing protein [Candidatus Kapaibacterium sp.]
MGQIWNRISRIAKTYLNDTSDTSAAEHILRSDDDELKRIIDELDNPKPNGQHTTTAEQQQPYEKQQQSQHTSQQRQSQHTSQQRQSQQRPRTSPGGMTLIKAATVLGIRTDASVSEIKAAYKKKVLKHHPDRMANAPLDEQAQSKQIIVEVNQAYQFFQQLKGF